MKLRPLEPDDPAQPAVDALLSSDPSRQLPGFDPRPGPGTVIIAGFESDEPICVGLFQDYRSPEVHLGNQLDLGRVRDLLSMDGVGLYQIALLHADPQRIGHADSAEALIGAFERWLGERYYRYALFISLMGKANKKARPLYKRLGFKRAGKGARLMRFDLNKLERKLKRIPELPESLEPRFFDAAGDDDLRSFAACYGEVFLEADEASMGPLGLENALRGITSAPDFAAELSLLLLSRAEGHVVGFMLADRSGPERMHIGVAGLLPEVRGNRLPYRCLPPIARRALAIGIRDATFVTSLGSVARLTLRAFGAREEERLETHYKVG